MPKYEYKVVPAPTKGEKARGVKSAEARFANTLMALMNDLGQDGWEYQRTDTLPCEIRKGLTGKSTSFQNMLVFRRTLEEQEVADDTKAAPAAPRFRHSEIQTDARAQILTAESAPLTEKKQPATALFRPSAARLRANSGKPTPDVAAE